MTKRQLLRYARMGREIHLIDAQMRGMETVTDVVKASSQHYPYLPCKVTIRGVDARRMLALRRRRAYLKARRAEVERFIGEVEDPYMRGVLWTRYIVGATWIQLGQMMNTTYESVKKAANRYLDSVCGH